MFILQLFQLHSHNTGQTTQKKNKKPTYFFQKLPSLIQTRQNEPLPLQVFLFQIIEAKARVSEMIFYH